MPKPKYQVLDFGQLTIETPDGWKKFKPLSFEGFGGGIAIDSTDTLSFGIGQYSGILVKTDTAFMNYLRSNHNILEDTIDGHAAKLISPKKPGSGMIGIFIDSLWLHGQRVEGFNMNGTHLKPINEQLFIRAIKTIRFHKDK